MTDDLPASGVVRGEDPAAAGALAHRLPSYSPNLARLETATTNLVLRGSVASLSGTGGSVQGRRVLEPRTGRRFSANPGIESRVRGGSEAVVVDAVIHWFFPRKAKIAFLAMMIYAALC